MSDVTSEMDSHVMTLTLDRPEVKNALSIDTADELALQIRAAAEDSEVHVIVITGAGKAFCGGGDLNRLAKGGTPIEVTRRLTDHMHRVAYAIEALDKPLVAAVNGDAFGAGMDIALMCDFRFTARSARFSDGYILAGLVPGDGAAYFLPRIVGLANALDLLLTGRTIDADEAYDMGIVHRVYEESALLPATRVFAAELAARPTDLVQMIKRAVYDSSRSDLRTSLGLVAAQMGVIRSTEGSAQSFRDFVDQRNSR
jgi:enoyl-CoA hydratase/carnithine racemase